VPHIESSLLYAETEENCSIKQQMKEIQDGGQVLSSTHIDFVDKLADALPRDADPAVAACNGIVDIFWDKSLVISIDEQGKVAISNFTSQTDMFTYFENSAIDEVIKFILDCYSSLTSPLHEVATPSQLSEIKELSK
jgi:hypothetical protein